MDGSLEIAELSALTDAEAAEHLLDPLRARLLGEARTPVSATELGERVGHGRQKVNYHVHQLAEAGLLERAGQRQRGNFTEKLYQATARAYLIAPSTLGSLAPVPDEGQDAFSAAHLLALTARTQSELASVLEDADARDERVATLSLDATLHFAHPEERAAFTQALEDAIARLVREHTTGPDASGQPPAGTRSFRLVVASHPVPADVDDTDREAADESGRTRHRSPP